MLLRTHPCRPTPNASVVNGRLPRRVRLPGQDRMYRLHSGWTLDGAFSLHTHRIYPKILCRRAGLQITHLRLSVRHPPAAKSGSTVMGFSLNYWALHATFAEHGCMDLKGATVPYQRGSDMDTNQLLNFVCARGVSRPSEKMIRWRH